MKYGRLSALFPLMLISSHSIGQQFPQSPWQQVPEGVYGNTNQIYQVPGQVPGQTNSQLARIEKILTDQKDLLEKQTKAILSLSEKISSLEGRVEALENN